LVPVEEVLDDFDMSELDGLLERLDTYSEEDQSRTRKCMIGKYARLAYDCTRCKDYKICIVHLKVVNYLSDHLPRQEVVEMMRKSKKELRANVGAFYRGFDIE